MNEIKLKVNFGKRTCVKSGISLTTGDYNSTKIKFEFDREDGTKIFEMKNPDGDIIFVDEIVNNEVILVGHADVTTKHNNVTYTKYTDDNETIYWYDNELEKLYNTSFEEVQNVSLDSLTKVTENASLFTMAGKYPFEISLYDGDSKLTSKSDYLDVKEEQVVINNNMVSLYLPVFDRLIGELDNLDIDVEKTGSTTTVTLTKKDGTTKEIEILDGFDGITPTIGNNGNWYLGETDTGKPSRGGKGDKGDTGNNGQDGANGQDGFSPIATVTETSDGATISITDKNGTTTAKIYNGTGGGGTSDYRNLENKPQINNVELTGNKTSSDLGLQPAGNYVIDSNYVHTDNNYSSNEKNKLDGIETGATRTIVDSSITNTSTNPIESKVIYNALNSKLDTSLKGSANGIAELDSNGKILESQLPSYVDDVLEGYYYNNNFYEDLAHTKLITSETGKIYIDLATNKTYRWGGSTYVLISETITLGETSSTAYRGDRGKIAYDHTLITSGNPHNVTKNDVGLGNVENKSSSTIRSEITSSNVTNALGYTPYDSSNPSGYTNNVGTITGITMNGVSKGTSGVVNLGTVITSHQDITGKEDKSNKVTSLSANSTDTQYPSAKCVYDYIQSLDGDEVNY